MRRLLEGSRAVAETVARCRPAVVPAYPITPQTHIVEALGALVKDGELDDCQFLTADSEFAALSAAVGASAAGARTYTATASQGLLYMAEVLFNAAGLELPIVMTVANRAVGAPINIWNDHSDAMSQRDCGWLQLYARDNQDAIDLHVLAFALAEELSLPAMVCVDGFVLTHAFEPLEVPDQDRVDGFLPPYRPRQFLDPGQPVTIGAMVGPDAFTEVRYLAHHQQLQALELFPPLANRFDRHFGRRPGLVTRYGAPEPETVVLTLGSTTGTVRSVVDELVAAGQPVGVLSLAMFRPFPSAAVRAALAGARRVVVLERAFAPGAGGIVAADLRQALVGTDTAISTVVAGLGGRAVSAGTVARLLSDAMSDILPDFSFADLDRPVTEREVARLHQQRTAGLWENQANLPGPQAESPELPVLAGEAR